MTGLGADPWVVHALCHLLSVAEQDILSINRTDNADREGWSVVLAGTAGPRAEWVSQVLVNWRIEKCTKGGLLCPDV